MSTTLSLGLTPLGPILFELPSYAARADLLGAYHQYREDSPRLGRVLAATVGACYGGKRPPGEGGLSLPRLPAYDATSGRVLAYGGEVLDHLVGLHQVPAGAELWAVGIALLSWLQSTMPSPKREADLVNFTSPPEGGQT